MAPPPSSSSSNRPIKPDFDRLLSRVSFTSDRPRAIVPGSSSELRGRDRAYIYASPSASGPSRILPEPSTELPLASTFYEPDFDRPSRTSAPSPRVPSLLARISSPPKGPRSQLLQQSPPQAFRPSSRPIPTGPRSSFQGPPSQPSADLLSPSKTYHRRSLSPPPTLPLLLLQQPRNLRRRPCNSNPRSQLSRNERLLNPTKQQHPSRASSMQTVIERVRLENARRRPGALDVGTDGGGRTNGQDHKRQKQQASSSLSMGRGNGTGTTSTVNRVASNAEQQDSARGSGPTDPVAPSPSSSSTVQQQQPSRSRPSAMSFFAQNEASKMDQGEQTSTRTEPTAPSFSSYSQLPQLSVQDLIRASITNQHQQPPIASSSQPIVASVAASTRTHHSQRSPSPSASSAANRGRSPEFFDRKVMRDEPRARSRSVEGRRRGEGTDDDRSRRGSSTTEGPRAAGGEEQRREDGEEEEKKKKWARRTSDSGRRRDSDERDAMKWKEGSSRRAEPEFSPPRRRDASPPPRTRRDPSPPPRRREPSPPPRRRDLSPPRRGRHYQSPPAHRRDASPHRRLRSISPHRPIVPRGRDSPPPPFRARRSPSPRRDKGFTRSRPRSRSPPPRRHEARSPSSDRTRRTDRLSSPPSRRTSPPPSRRGPPPKDAKLIPPTDTKLLIIDLDPSVGRIQIEEMLEFIALVKPVEIRLSSAESAIFFDTQDDAEQTFAVTNKLVIDSDGHVLHLAWPVGTEPSTPTGRILRVDAKSSITAIGLYLSLLRYGLIIACFPWSSDRRRFSFVLQFRDRSSDQALLSDHRHGSLDHRAFADLCVTGLKSDDDEGLFLSHLQEGGIVAFKKGSSKSSIFFQVGSLVRTRDVVKAYGQGRSFGSGIVLRVGYGVLQTRAEFGLEVLELDRLPQRPRQEWRCLAELPTARRPSANRLQHLEPNYPRRDSHPSSTRRRSRSASPPPPRRISYQPEPETTSSDASRNQEDPSATATSATVEVEEETEEGRVDEQKVVRAPRLKLSFAGVGDDSDDDSDEEVNAVAAVEAPVDHLAHQPLQEPSHAYHQQPNEPPPPPQLAPGGLPSVALSNGSNAVPTVPLLTPEQQAIIQQTIQAIQQQQQPAPPPHLQQQNQQSFLPPPPPPSQLQPPPLFAPYHSPVQSTSDPLQRPPPPPPGPNPVLTGFSNEQLLDHLSVQYPAGTRAREELRIKDPGVSFSVERREAELSAWVEMLLGSSSRGW